MGIQRCLSKFSARRYAMRPLEFFFLFFFKEKKKKKKKKKTFSHHYVKIYPADDYFLTRLPIVTLRLAQAGVRLAASLNRIFGRKYVAVM